MFTVRQMAYFEALARTGHFGRAAQQVHVSQPALSAQIGAMEERLGHRLFERNRGDVRLTEQGLRLLPRIRQILEMVDSLTEFAAEDGGFLGGQLRLGVIPTVAPYLLPALIPALRADYPELKIDLREMVTGRLVEALRNREIDAFVAATPIDAAGIEARPLFRDRFHMAMSRNEDTMLVGPVQPENIEIDKLLLLEEGHCLRDQALAICEKGKPRRIVNYGATSMATLVQMVSSGLGMTLIPEIAVASENRDSSMRIIPFAAPVPYRTIALFWREAGERRTEFELLAETIARTAGDLCPGCRDSLKAEASRNGENGSASAG